MVRWPLRPVDAPTNQKQTGLHSVHIHGSLFLLALPLLFPLFFTFRHGLLSNRRVKFEQPQSTTAKHELLSFTQKILHHNVVSTLRTRSEIGVHGRTHKHTLSHAYERFRALFWYVALWAIGIDHGRPLNAFSFRSRDNKKLIIFFFINHVTEQNSALYL